MDSDWIKIYSSNQEFEALIRKGVLEEQEIDCVIINKKDSAYLFGEVELYVPKEQVLSASNLLNSEFERE